MYPIMPRIPNPPNSLVCIKASLFHPCKRMDYLPDTQCQRTSMLFRRWKNPEKETAISIPVIPGHLNEIAQTDYSLSVLSSMIESEISDMSPRMVIWKVH